MRYEDFKKGLLEKNPKLKAEYSTPKLEREVAEMVMRERIQKNMTQAELARRMGMQQPAIARIESGDYVPHARSLEKIARALGAKLEISFSNKEENGTRDGEWKWIPGDKEIVQVIAKGTVETETNKGKKRNHVTTTSYA